MPHSDMKTAVYKATMYIKIVRSCSSCCTCAGLWAGYFSTGILFRKPYFQDQIATTKISGNKVHAGKKKQLYGNWSE